MAFDVWVDFNSLNDGVVRTLTSFVPPHVTLTVGKDVLVGDDEGTSASARVESLDGDVVTLRVDMSSIVSTDISQVSGLAQ